MIALTFTWGLSALLIGVTGSPDCTVIGLILVGMAAVMWTVNFFYTGWVANRNASATLEASEIRRRSGGAV